MSTGWLVFILGIVVGLGFGATIGYLWGHRNGHLDGYQDHRDEVRELRNAADLAAAADTGAELEVRAKTAPVPQWEYRSNLAAAAGDTVALPRLPAPMLTDRWASLLPGAVPGGGRPFPLASNRTHTTAADIGPVVALDDERRPVSVTGPMRTPSDEAEDIIRRIQEGTWP